MEQNEMEGWGETWSSGSDTEESGSSYSEDSNSSPRMEAARVGSESLLLPQGLCDNPEVFKELLSLDTWRHFTDQQKQHIQSLLPSFPDNDSEEKEKTLKMLFNRENIRFGNPLNDFHNKLQAGYFRPDVSRMRTLLKKAQYKDYKRAERWRMYELVKSVLCSRQRLVEAVVNGEKPKISVPPTKKLKPSANSQNVRSRYFQELALIREEVGESSQSSEDENYPEGCSSSLNKRLRRTANLPELFGSDSEPVLGSLCTGPTPWDMNSKVPQNNPYAPAEQSYAQMLAHHMKRRSNREDHPDLQVDGITLADIAMRCKMTRKLPPSKPLVSRRPKPQKMPRPLPTPSPMENICLKVEDEADDVSDLEEALGVKVEPEDEIDKVDVEGVDDLPPIPPAIAKSVISHPSIPTKNKGPLLGKRIKVETPEPKKTFVEPESKTKRTEPIDNRKTKDDLEVVIKKIKVEPTEKKIEHTEQPAVSIKSEPVFPPITTASVINPPTSSSVFSTASIKPAPSRLMTPATLSDLDGIDMMDLPVDFDESSPVSLDDLKPHPELMQETHACFFSLIRDILLSTPDHRIEMKELETRIKTWASSPIGPINSWYTPQLEFQLSSAVLFLTGDLPEILPEDYVPYMEWKANVGAYQWIGAGRDSDQRLVMLCSFWLERGADRGAQTTAPVLIVPDPPPRGPALRPTSPRLREMFREQEKQRFDAPHKAFTYNIGGVESIVGPVRSIQTGNLNKARGHTLLIDDRPKYVTILELVRDAVARLPNAQGTRADIVTLLKDSQYLNVTAAETMLSSVVSGALDRLHSEPDPPVKYDAKRKIWVNLHKGRSAEEFERLHALGVDMKPSRPKTPRKPAKPKKELPKVDLIEKVVESTQPVDQPVTTTPDLSAPIIITKPKPVMTTTPVTAATTTAAAPKKVINEGVKSLLAKGRVKIQDLSPLSQQQLLRLQSPMNSTLKRATEVQKIATSTIPVRTNLQEPVARTQSQNIVKKMNPQSVTITADQVKHGGKSIVKVITTQGTNQGIRTIQRVPQVSQQQVIQLKQQLIGDQAIIQKGQMKKSSGQGQQQLIVMKQASGDQGGSGQQQMIVINQQQIVMDSQQLTLKQQKQIQHILNKQQQQLEQPSQSQQGNSNTVIQKLVPQQMQQLILAKQQQMVVDQQKTGKGQQMIVVKQGASTGDNIKQPVQQMILVKQTGADGETTTQITQQQLQQMILMKQQQQLQQSNQQQIIMVKQQDQKSVQVITQPSKGQTQQLTLAQLQQHQRNSGSNVLGHPRVVAHVSGGPVSTVSAASLIKPQNPSGTSVVTKMMTNSATPVLTMESILAHHKQQTVTTQQAGVRMPNRTGVTSQYVVSLPQTRVVQTVPQVIPTSSSGSVVVSAVCNDSTKIAASTQSVRIPGLNLASLSGKQVLLASKPQGAGSVQAQNVLLGNSGQTLLVGGGQQGTVTVLQQGSQQILIPPGALKTLQGLKVIPLSQAKPSQSSGRQQVFARIINPSSVRPAVLTANLVQQEAPSPSPSSQPKE